MDVGLGDVNPLAHARGEELETVFVGELLCWLGQKSGILPLGYREGAIPRQNEEAEVAELAEEEDDDGEEDVFGKARDNTISSADSRHGTRAATPSTRSTLTDSVRATLSMINASHEKRTRMEMYHIAIAPSSKTFQFNTPAGSRPLITRRKLGPSWQNIARIPLTGWFIHRKRHPMRDWVTLLRVPLGSSHDTPPPVHNTALRFLNEKARLLTELANLNISTRQQLCTRAELCDTGVDLQLIYPHPSP